MCHVPSPSTVASLGLPKSFLTWDRLVWNPLIACSATINVENVHCNLWARTNFRACRVALLSICLYQNRIDTQVCHKNGKKNCFSHLCSQFVGHSFRRTSATFLANSGADIETIMRHGGWRNESCAKEYIEDSLAYKARTGDMIQRAILGQVAPSIVPTTNVQFNASDVIDNEQLIGIVGTSSQSYRPIIAPNSPTVVPSNAPTVVRTNAPTIPPTNAELNASDGIDNELFDSFISNEQLVEIVDHANQSYQQAEVLASNDTGGGEIDNTIRELMHEDNADFASSAVLTQSTSNSVLNAILARSFKSVNFGRMANCHFNFYFTKWISHSINSIYFNFNIQCYSRNLYFRRNF